MPGPLSAKDAAASLALVSRVTTTTTTITPLAGQNTFFSGGSGGGASKGKQTGVIVLPHGKIKAEDQRNKAVKNSPEKSSKLRLGPRQLGWQLQLG